MRPHALGDAVVVGHNLGFQRVIGNAFQNGILTARTEFVEAVVALTDHRFPDEKLRGNQVQRSSAPALLERQLVERLPV